MRPIPEDTYEDKISYARQKVTFEAPYVASIVNGFIYVPLEGIGTMLCTPKMVLGYDPAWAKVATVNQLAADVFHEVNHFLRRHFERAGLVESPNLFNLAGDLTINPDMRNAGWELADESTIAPAVFPEQFDLPEGLSTEEYYNKLLQKKADGTLKSKTKGRGKGQKQDDQKTGGGAAPPPSPTKQPPPAESEGGGVGEQENQTKEDDPTGGICSGHCGGIAGGSDDPRLEDALDAKEGRSEVEIKNITKRAAADIQAHIEKSGRGKMPKDIADLAHKLMEEPHVRWQSELAHVLHHATGRMQSGGDDFSMTHPSKRSYMRGVVRPGMVEYQPEIAIIRDSSASMSSKMLTDCTREAYHIIQALGIDEVWFADADADVAMPWKRVGSQFFRDLKNVFGRGGTDFCPGIAAAQKLLPRPDILIYCTDGDGNAPTKPPQDMAVVWCLIARGRARPQAPARWGHQVIVSDDPNQRKLKPLPTTNSDTATDDADDATTSV